MTPEASSARASTPAGPRRAGGAAHDPGGVGGQGVHGGGAQAGGKDAVEGRRGSPGLDVAEGGEVGLVAAAGLVDDLAELLRRWGSALGDHDREARLALLVGLVQEVEDFLRVRLELGYDRRVGAARDRARYGQVARVGARAPRD